MNKKGTWIRCTECGAYLDRGEYHVHRCECERMIAEKKAEQKKARTAGIVAHNMRMMEQAAIEWEYA